MLLTQYFTFLWNYVFNTGRSLSHRVHSLKLWSHLKSWDLKPKMVLWYTECYCYKCLLHFLGKLIIHMIQNTGRIKKEQSNSDFIFRIVTSSLNNSLYCNMNGSFLLIFWGMPSWAGNRWRQTWKVSYSEFINNWNNYYTETRLIPPWQQTMIISLPKFKVKSWPVAQGDVDLQSITISDFTDP